MKKDQLYKELFEMHKRLYLILNELDKEEREEEKENKPNYAYREEQIKKLVEELKKEWPENKIWVQGTGWVATPREVYIIRDEGDPVKLWNIDIRMIYKRMNQLAERD